MDIAGAIRKQFLAIHEELNGAVVYCDDGAMEAVQSTVGLRFLFDHGVGNVCALHDACDRDAALARMRDDAATTTRVIVFVTTMLHAAADAVVHAMLAHSVGETVVYSSLSEAAHVRCGGAMWRATPTFIDFATTLQRGISPRGDMPCSVTVRHFPLHVCAVTPSAFVLPAASAAATSCRWNERAAGYSAAPHAVQYGGTPRHAKRSRDSADAFADSDDDIDDGAAQHSTTLLACALADAAQQLGVKWDVFAMGRAATDVARSMVGGGSGDVISWARSIADAASQHTTASLLLVDRCLDVVTPLLDADHIMDAAVQCMRPPQHATAAIDSSMAEQHGTLHITPTYSCASDTQQQTGAANGEGATTITPVATGAWKWVRELMTRSGVDAALVLRKWLKEALRAEGSQRPPPSKPGSVPPTELRQLIAMLCATPRGAWKHRHLIALARAALTASSHPHALLRDAEMQLMKCSRADDAAQTLVDFVASFITSHGTEQQHAALHDDADTAQHGDGDALSLADVLCIVAIAYALHADRSMHEHYDGDDVIPLQAQMQLRQLLHDAVMQCSHDGTVSTMFGDVGQRIARHISQRARSRASSTDSGVRSPAAQSSQGRNKAQHHSNTNSAISDATRHGAIVNEHGAQHAEASSPATDSNAEKEGWDFDDIILTNTANDASPSSHNARDDAVSHARDGNDGGDAAKSTARVPVRLNSVHDNPTFSNSPDNHEQSTATAQHDSSQDGWGDWDDGFDVMNAVSSSSPRDATHATSQHGGNHGSTAETSTAHAAHERGNDGDGGDDYELRGLQLELDDAIDDKLTSLQMVAGVRDGMKDFTRLMAGTSAAYGPHASFMPLIAQLTNALLLGLPLPDMRHAESTLSGIIKSGMQRFGLKQTHKSAHDNALIVVFVVGGVCMRELRAVMHVLQQHAARSADVSMPTIMVAGTCLVSRHDVVTHLLTPL